MWSHVPCVSPHATSGCAPRSARWPLSLTRERRWHPLLVQPRHSPRRLHRQLQPPHRHRARRRRLPTCAERRAAQEAGRDQHLPMRASPAAGKGDSAQRRQRAAAFREVVRPRRIRRRRCGRRCHLAARAARRSGCIAARADAWRAHSSSLTCVASVIAAGGSIGSGGSVGSGGGGSSHRDSPVAGCAK